MEWRSWTEDVQKRAVRKVFGSRWKERIGSWRILRSVELLRFVPFTYKSDQASRSWASLYRILVGWAKWHIWEFPLRLWFSQLYNSTFHKIWRTSFLAENLLAAHGLCSVELVCWLVLFNQWYILIPLSTSNIVYNFSIWKAWYIK
jgi:hypothetical protein